MGSLVMHISSSSFAHHTVITVYMFYNNIWSLENAVKNSIWIATAGASWYTLATIAAGFIFLKIS